MRGRQRVLTADDTEAAPRPSWLGGPRPAGISKGRSDARRRSLVRQASPGRARDMADGAGRRLPRPALPSEVTTPPVPRCPARQAPPPPACCSGRCRASRGTPSRSCSRRTPARSDKPAVRDADHRPCSARCRTCAYVSSVTSPYSPGGRRSRSARARPIAFATVNFSGTPTASRPPRRPSSSTWPERRTRRTSRSTSSVPSPPRPTRPPRRAPSSALPPPWSSCCCSSAPCCPRCSRCSAPAIALIAGLGGGRRCCPTRVSMASFTSQLCTLIGLGVGIDYSLFILTRARNGLRRGLSVRRRGRRRRRPPPAGPCSSPGMTVCIALLGILTVGVSTLSGAAIARLDRRRIPGRLPP